mgnify:CR=1 FL=1
MQMEPMELQHVVFETEEKGRVDAMWSDVRLHEHDITDGWHCYAVRAATADGRHAASRKQYGSTTRATSSRPTTSTRCSKGTVDARHQGLVVHRRTVRARRMKGDMDMKEKNRAEEWFRAKHDELAETAQANLAAHDLEPGQEAYHLDSLHYATAEQMEAICPTGIDFDRYATLANGSVGYDEADAHWADAAWWDEQARTMWDEVDDIPDDGLYWTSVED